jgi:hypothetical protein
MPEFARFLGMVITMYYDESTHPGFPHYHARYGEAEALIGLAPIALVAGSLPRLQLAVLRQWTVQHHEELMNNWNRRANGLPLAKVAYP